MGLVPARSGDIRLDGTSIAAASPRRSRAAAVSPSCPRAAGSSPSLRSRRTSGSGSWLGGDRPRRRAANSHGSEELFPRRPRVPRPAGRSALGRPAAAARDRAGARCRGRACCFWTSRRSGSRRSRGRRLRGARSDPRPRRRPCCSSSNAPSARSRSPTGRTCIDERRRINDDALHPPTRTTPTGSSPPTWPRDPHPGAHRRGRSSAPLYALIAVGIGLVFGVLRTDQLRVRPADHDRRLHAGLHRRLARRGEHRDRGARRGLRLARDGAGRVPAAADDRRPSTMLVATFAVSFLLQNVGAPPLHVPERGGRRRPGGDAGRLNRAATIGSLHVRWITFVAIGAGARLPRRARHSCSTGPRSACRCARPHRLPHRAAARRAGEHGDHGRGRRRRRAGGDRRGDPHRPEPAGPNTTRPERDDHRARRRGRRAGSTGSLSATLGGFAIGFATSFLGLELATQGSTSQTAVPFTSSVYLPSVIYVARHPRPAAPAGGALRADGARRRWSGYEAGRSTARRPTLLGPVAARRPAGGIASQPVNAADDVKFRNAIVNVALVVALYVFVGNSGVISRSARSASSPSARSQPALMTVPRDVEAAACCPTCSRSSSDHSISNPWSLVLAAALGRRLRARGRHPADAAVRARGGHRHVRRARASPTTSSPTGRGSGQGATTLSLIPDTTDYVQATVGAVAVIAIAFAYQRSRWGRQLRADPRGPGGRAGGRDRHPPPAPARLRALRRSLRASPAGCSSTCSGSITTNQVYLDLTFLTLAMLVVGGMHSLFGAVVGAIGDQPLQHPAPERRERHPRLRLGDQAAAGSRSSASRS